MMTEGQPLPPKRCCENPAGGEEGKILVTGYPYWAGVAAGLLRRAGFEAAVWRTEPDEVPAILRWNCALRWLFHFLRPSFRAARALHVAGATTSTMLLWLVRRLGKRIILHWVGTDVLHLQQSAAGDGKRLRFCRKVAAAHFADSPEIVAELAEMGIRAEVFRLLPETVEPRDVPMPSQPAVLSYWSPERRTFYGGEIVDALADEFPDVPHIAEYEQALSDYFGGLHAITFGGGASSGESGLESQ